MGFFTGKKVKKTASDGDSNKPLPSLPPRPGTSSASQRNQGASTSTSPATGNYWQSQQLEQQQQEQQFYSPPLTHLHQHHPSPFQPAGYLPAPPGWSPSPPSFDGGYHSVAQQSRPIVVNQYYIHPTHIDPHGPLAKLGSAVSVAKGIAPGTAQLYDDGLSLWHQYGTQVLNSTAAMADQISSALNHVMTMIDVGKYTGNEPEIFSHPAISALPQVAEQPQPAVQQSRGMLPGKKEKAKRPGEKVHPKGQTSNVAANVVSGSYFDKVDMYSNSRLPRKMDQFKMYIHSWSTVCLAAQYAERVYDSPKGSEKDTHVSADWKTGTKAMVIKSVPMDDMSTIVFAIRGTATFMDWAVNLNTAPASPVGFLDDASNFCHAGFLSVARKMVSPVATRLRQLLEEDPGRSSYSLVITGHSAGGAVAALLYCHMLSSSQGAVSELKHLTGVFKRIHCITFGTPPISLKPLTRPDHVQAKKSLFISFINEGDPVARADKAYVRSLIELLASAPPQRVLKSNSSKAAAKMPKKKQSKASLASKKSSLSTSSTLVSTSTSSSSKKPIWTVPNCTLANAGKIVILRSGDPKARKKGTRRTIEERLNEGVVAMTCEEDLLRGCIWGDPACHVMKLYKGRVETLAVGAVMAGGGKR